MPSSASSVRTAASSASTSSGGTRQAASPTRSGSPPTRVATSGVPDPQRLLGEELTGLPDAADHGDVGRGEQVPHVVAVAEQGHRGPGGEDLGGQLAGTPDRCPRSPRPAAGRAAAIGPPRRPGCGSPSADAAGRPRRSSGRPTASSSARTSSAPPGDTGSAGAATGPRRASRAPSAAARATRSSDAPSVTSADRATTPLGHAQRPRPYAVAQHGVVPGHHERAWTRAGPTPRPDRRAARARAPRRPGRRAAPAAARRPAPRSRPPGRAGISSARHARARRRRTELRLGGGRTVHRHRRAVPRAARAPARARDGPCRPCSIRARGRCAGPRARSRPAPRRSRFPSHPPSISPATSGPSIPAGPTHLSCVARRRGAHRTYRRSSADRHGDEGHHDRRCPRPTTPPSAAPTPAPASASGCERATRRPT